MRNRRLAMLTRPSAIAVALLVALWGLYFWRILTPDETNALSLTEGDFSGQFVAFLGYQTSRLAEGEVPRWNPYNYAGHPFLADTQSAVFYPPRLLTVSMLTIFTDQTPGDLYTALQTEMALHVLLGTLLMYAFVRRLIAAGGTPLPTAAVGGVVAALTYGYGGYLSGYPQLQLAVLEAGIWLPLVLLALFEATEPADADIPPTGGRRFGARCVVLAGTALGLSLLAGHPQTSFFALYLALAWLAWRLWHGDGRAWLRAFIPAAALLGMVAGGLAAAQLVPGLEYLQHTTRTAMSFDAKSNGFPFADLAQVVLPGYLTLWSPLYVGIAGLALIGWAVWRGVPHRHFFGIAALVGLGWSFGAGTVIYDAVYLLLPGASWFRGQERAALVVAHSASVLAGLGAAHLLTHARTTDTRPFIRALVALAAGCGLVAAVFFVLAHEWEPYADGLQAASFATILAVLTLAVTWQARRAAGPGIAAALVALVVFDLFSTTMGAANYDPVPAWERLAPPPLIEEIRESLPPGARVDGTGGLGANYATLYNVPDIHGISPLELSGVHAIRDNLPPARTWDLLAVHQVLLDWDELPVPSTITATDPDTGTHVHQLESPRDFAHLTYGVTVVGSDGEAYGLLREPAYDTRRWAILDRDPGVDLPGSAPDTPGRTAITRFAPEAITIMVETPSAAILTLALPHVPGWRAMLNGDRVDIVRAYGGLSAVALPAAGSYTLRLEYAPWTFTLGAALSLATLAVLIASTAATWWVRRRSHQTPP